MRSAAWVALGAIACSSPSDKSPGATPSSAVAASAPAIGATVESSASTGDRDEAKKLVVKGRKLSDEKQWRRAAETFEAAVRADGTFDVAHAELGWALLQAGDPIASRKASLAALEHTLEPKIRAQVLYNLGRAEEENGDVSEARKRYEESYALRPHAEVRARLRRVGGAASDAPEIPCARSFPTVADACACLADEYGARDPKAPAPTCERLAPTEGVASGAEVVMVRTTQGTTVWVLAEVDGRLRPARMLAEAAVAEVRRISELSKGSSRGFVVVYRASADEDARRLACTVSGDEVKCDA